jgi:hypothetical protein
LKTHCILGLLAILNLAACTASSPKSTSRPATVVASKAEDSDAQLADAMKLVSQKEWPQALAALRAIVDAKTFSSLPSDVQYRALSAASRTAIYHGPENLGYGYLDRVIAMPQAGYRDWWERLREADQTHNKAELVSTLTVMMQRWPDRSGKLNPDYILSVVNEAKQLPNGAALPLLQALYGAHWKLKWEIEPSTAWRDLTLLLLDKARIAEAHEVASHVTDVYVLIAMRADRRLDAVIAANPAQFDIKAATGREFQARQAAADKTPQSLELKTWVINSLLRQQHYEAALAASDSVVLDIRSTNYPEKLYDDYDETRSWFLDLRATALERVGRWDEAVAQLTAASLLSEKYTGNVDQLINLGDLYCELERPRDALATIGSMVAPTSPFGAMQLESVRLEAAEQLRDTQQVRRSLDYVRAHRADAPSTYVDSLIVVNQLDQAARVLIAQLLDKDQRQAALLSVQGFAPIPGTPRDMTLAARRRAVIARPDVRAAIDKVGRVDSYRVEAPWA